MIKNSKVYIGVPNTTDGKMTVNISLSNGLDAILLCDEMGTWQYMSGGGRQSASLTKIGEIGGGASTYHGALVGAGDGNLVTGILLMLANGELKGESLPDFVESVKDYFVKKIDSHDRTQLADLMNSSQKKAELIDDPAAKRQFLDAERARIWQQFDAFKEQQRQNPAVQLLVAAYDASVNRIRTILVNDIFLNELYVPHLEIGSGQDAAHLYFVENLQGVDTSKLRTPELLFHVGSAYMKSTLNLGVGGTPRVVIINSEKMAKLNSGLVAILTNVCGYHLAGAVTKDEAIEVANAVASTTSQGMETLTKGLCERVHVSIDDLAGATVPLSVIYQRVNLYQRLTPREMVPPIGAGNE